jgi:Ser/Thr protein kinase RdoA (MazF antagonist)
MALLSHNQRRERMLKLKYLFDNHELATMMLKNWKYDVESIDLFKYYRISSNAIYPFRASGKLMFLRMTPASERSGEAIESELVILQKLKDKGYSVPEVIEPLNGERLIKKDTPWGVYYAVVLEGVGSQSLENTDLTPALCYQYGKFLADFHKLSKAYLNGYSSRVNVFDLLQALSDKVNGCDDYHQAVEHELIRVWDGFKNSDRTESMFGLIHYDFELDNIMYDPATSTLYAIDFDDAMYGFYGQDIERAINSLESEVSSEDFSEFKSEFLAGYSDNGLDVHDYHENGELYKAFAKLYAHVRIKESLKETWDNEPEWMAGLREKLTARIVGYENSLLLG